MKRESSAMITGPPFLTRERATCHRDGRLGISRYREEMTDSRQRSSQSFLDELELTSSSLDVFAVMQVPYRHRFESHEQEARFLPDLAWRAGAAIVLADRSLEALGVPWLETEFANDQDAWGFALRTGLDDFGRMCWFLRFGHTMAGLAIARHMLERWTYNLGSSINVRIESNEPFEDYLRRVWEIYSDMLDGRDIGDEWATLSELLHGRVADVDGHRARVHFEMPDDDRTAVHRFAVRIAELALRQVRGCINTALEEQSIPITLQDKMLQVPADRLPTIAEPDFLGVLSSPLDWDFVSSDLARTISGWGEAYRGIIAHPNAASVSMPAPPWMAIEERWCRAVDVAEKAFADEQEMLGERFDPLGLTATLMQYRAVSELADLAAGVLGPCAQREALEMAATALESAWGLWLHDVDESMTCMRGVLEGAARARCHRTKPARASELEARGASTSPHRWLEGAGWGRLSSFNRALGEFSHVQERSRRDRARDLLTAMQRNAEEGGEVHTARARALEEVARTLAHETAATLESTHPALAASLREIAFGVSTAREADQLLERWLDHGLAFRGFDFGPAVLSEREAKNVEHSRRNGEMSRDAPPTDVAES